ncbi:MAG: ThiF family adenylyltransferase [Thermogutta sp.]
MDAHTYYQLAFSRNIGIFSEADQALLRRACVAVAGLGGVGGLHVITLARMGVGAFHMADMDVFEPVNVNRQYGAKVQNFGRPKLEVMVEEALAVNPHLKIVLFPEGITEDNLDQFLEGAHVVLDGLDFFYFPIRRLLFNRARQKGLYVVTAAPLGFSTAVLVFSPFDGMNFDEYFNTSSELSDEDAYLRFAMGLAPRPTHLRYLDLSRVNLQDRAGPSVASACQLCAGAAATETAKILLGRGSVRSVPHFVQFDPYTWTLRRGRLALGNRNPLQKIKAYVIKRFLLSNSRATRPTATRLLGFFMKRDPLFTQHTPDWRPRPLAWPGRITARPIPQPVLDYLLNAAVQAPSGDNAQPWTFSLDGDAIEIRLEPERDRSFFNVEQVASVIACGAAAENIRIAATLFGLDTHLEVCVDATAESMCARLVLEPSNIIACDPLHDWLWKRHTNRKPFLGTRVSPIVVESLLRACDVRSGAQLHVVQEKKRLKDLARLVYLVDRIRTEDRRLHEHLHHMIRRSTTEAMRTRDGLPLKNLEVGRAGEVFLRLSRPWAVMSVLNRLGAARAVALHSAQAMRQAAAAGLLTVSGTAPQDFFHGGRSMQRIWLTATAYGLAFQPMTAVTFFWTRYQREGFSSFLPKHRRLLERAFALYHDLFPDVDFSRAGHAMLFRLGYALPISTPTLRRPAKVVPTRTQRSNGMEKGGFCLHEPV